MGDHPHSAFWQEQAPYASTSSASASGLPFPHPYHAPGYGQEPRFAYGYENGLAPIRDPPVQHNSIHPAVQSSLWRGSFPSPTHSYHELRAEGTTGSGGRSPSTESPPLPQAPAYQHSRSYSYGAPGSTQGDFNGSLREYPRPLVLVGHGIGLGTREGDGADCFATLVQSSAPSDSRVGGSGKVKPFISKLMALLADGEVNQDVLAWE